MIDVLPAVISCLSPLLVASQIHKTQRMRELFWTKGSSTLKYR